HSGVERLSGILPPPPHLVAHDRSFQTEVHLRSDSEELLPQSDPLDGKLNMAQASLAELTARAAAAAEPGFTQATVPKLGGVDPLGLRQINFDLMDLVFP